MAKNSTTPQRDRGSSTTRWDGNSTTPKLARYSKTTPRDRDRPTTQRDLDNTYGYADIGTLGPQINTRAPNLGSTVNLGNSLNPHEDASIIALKSRMGESSSRAREQIAEEQADMERERKDFIFDRDRYTSRGREDFESNLRDGTNSAGLDRTRALEDLDRGQASGLRSIDQSRESSGLLRSSQTGVDRGRLNDTINLNRQRVELDSTDRLRAINNFYSVGQGRLTEDDELMRSRFDRSYQEALADLEKRRGQIGAGDGGRLSEALNSVSQRNKQRAADYDALYVDIPAATTTYNRTQARPPLSDTVRRVLSRNKSANFFS